MPDGATAPRTGFVAWLRRAWPWLVGIAMFVLVATRVPFDAFRTALGHGPHLSLAAINLALNVLILCSDSLATWIALAVASIRRPFAEVAAVRGATYALLVVNYALGQGAFGYYLHRSGEPPMRATGATLFVVGTNLATLLVVATATTTLGFVDAPNTRLQWTLEIGCIAFAAYLVVIALGPATLKRRQLFAPLFDAGITGHVLAMVGRLPHLCVLVLGHWVALRAWGIPVPFSVGLALMPAIIIAASLPIAPAGLGTTQAAFVLFFSDYAAGATADDRSAALLAFAIVHFVYGVAASLLVGFACLPFARRSGALKTT